MNSTTMPKRLSDVLNQFERQGKLNVFTSELQAELPDVSVEALRKARYRQQVAGRLVPVSRGADHWLIVPLQYAMSGSPPLEVWLDSYLRNTLQVTYYLGLLSAAEVYGASPYAVMVSQVMVAHKRRPVVVGRHKIVFCTRTRIESMPFRWHETPDGRVRVSTPELTVLDLIQRAEAVGGMGRVREVVQGLWSQCSSESFIDALNALQNLPVGQRLGVLMELDSQSELAAVVAGWLKGKPIRGIALEGMLPQDSRTDCSLNMRFKVWIADSFQGANS